MAQNTLSTTTADSGTQTTTQSPQASVSAGGFGGGQQSSAVQPGTATNLLNSQNGIPLKTNALSTVNLNAPTAAQTQPTVTTPPRHVNPALFGFSVVLFLIAVFLFWSASRSAKNTTK